jgi:putative PIG3 family NAD(P)H quinone oxidoreductase
MNAIVITRPGPPDVLQLQDRPDPKPGNGEVMVRVAASAVNRADLLQRRGQYAAPEGWPADIPGLEYAGLIEEIGADVGGWSIGDRVMGLVGGGGYAEYVVVPAAELVPVPEALGLEEAGGVPEVFITAHDALRTRAGLRSGETLLIHAVGSGVGTAAVQLAKAWGCRVLGTSRTGWKLGRARELGLDEPIDAADGAFAAAVRDATDGRGVDVVLDLVGAGYLEENLRSLATLGRHVVVGLPSGREASLDLGLLLRNRLTLVGTALRTRTPEEKAEAARSFGDDVVPLLAGGTVRPVIHATFPMADAARAHALVESNETFGKVILAWPAK